MFDEQFLQQIFAARDMQAVRVELSRRRKPGRDGAHRSHHDIRLLIAEPPKRRCARLLNVGMRRDAGIRIGFPCREWAHAVQPVCVEFCVVIIDVGRQRFNATILRRDDNQRTAERLCQSRNEQSPRASGETRHHDVRLTAKRIGGNAAEVCDIRNARQDFVDAFFENFHCYCSRNAYRLKTRSRISLVEYPSTRGSAATFPPQLSTCA